MVAETALTLGAMEQSEVRQALLDAAGAMAKHASAYAEQINPQAPSGGEDQRFSDEAMNYARALADTARVFAEAAEIVQRRP